MSAAITNITDRNIIDQQLQASLKEKEALLQEVHHRGKNKMQFAVSHSMQKNKPKPWACGLCL
jgi:two-component sensor histidine kinase